MENQTNKTKDVNIFIFLWGLIIISILLNLSIFFVYNRSLVDFHKESSEIVKLGTNLNGFLKDASRYYENEHEHLSKLLDTNLIEVHSTMLFRKNIDDFVSANLIVERSELWSLVDELSKYAKEISSVERSIDQWRVGYSNIYADIK